MRKERREKMITRTCVFTIAQVTCLNVETCEVEVKNFTASGKYDTIDLLLEQLRFLYETSTYKLVVVNEFNIVSQLRGMTESDFLALSVSLPDRKDYSKEEV